MPPLELNSLSYDIIGDYIERSARSGKPDALYLLSRAAAYVDIASAYGLLSKLQAQELRTCVAVYAGLFSA